MTEQTKGYTMAHNAHVVHYYYQQAYKLRSEGRTCEADGALMYAAWLEYDA